MIRVQKCRVCDAILHCAVCGSRQTPESAEERKRKSVKVGLSARQHTLIQKQARSLRLTKSAFIRKVLMLFLSSDILARIEKEASSLNLSVDDYVNALVSKDIKIRRSRKE